MKGILHYLFLVVLVFVVGLEVLYGIQQDSALQYSTTDNLYISNNPNGIILSQEAIASIEETDGLLIIAEDESGRTQINDFTQIQLVSGRAPASVGEYLLPENSANACDAEDTTPVGTYAETLSFNGLGCLFYLESLDEAFVVQIQASELSGGELVNLLTDAGFIEVTSENFDKVIRSDMMALMGLILSAFIAILLIAGLTGWLALAGKKISDDKRNIQVLQHFGGSHAEVAWTYLALNQRTWIKIAGIYFVVYLLVAGVTGYLGISARLYLFAVAWVATIAVLILSYQLLTLCVNYGKPLTGVKAPAYLAEILVLCIGLGGWYLTQNLLCLLITVLLILLLQVRKRSVIDRAVFSQTRIVSSAIFVVLAAVTVCNMGVFAVAVNAAEKEDQAIATSLPYNVQFVAQDIPAEVPAELQAQLYRHYYINPVDGIEYEGTSYFPLIYSTELSKYQDYLDTEGELSDESVLVGRGIATKSGIQPGDVIAINGVSVTATHIVNTEQYGGMMIYLSDEKFVDLFGNSGTVYYFTDLPVETLEEYFPESAGLIDQETYREYYRNSVTSIMVMLIVLCVVVVVVSVMVIYSLLSLFLSSVEWKVNLLRGFGISKPEFGGALLQMFGLLCLAALYVCVVLGKPLTDLLTTLILDITDSYFEMLVTWEVVVGMVAIYAFLCLLLIVPRVLRMNKLSIYQQYLLTRPGE